MNHNVLTKSESYQDGNSCTEYHQFLCQKSSQEERVVTLAPPRQGLGPLGSGAMTGPTSAAHEGQHNGAFPSPTVANYWKTLCTICIGCSSLYNI